MFEIGTATDHADLLEKLHAFLTTNGSASGLTYAGTGTGLLTGYKGGSASVAETFTLTATSATNFTVVGSVTGALAAATVGTPYTGTKIQFLISAGGTAFIAGDVFVLNTAPKWVAQHRARGCYVTGSAGVSESSVIDGKQAADASRNWQPGTGTGTLQFDFLEAETIAEYAIIPDVSTNGRPTAWTFDYWNGSSWVNLDTRSSYTSWSIGGPVPFTVASPVSAVRYRINVTAISASPLTISAVELRRAANGINVAFSQYLWKAPGSDGTSSIYVGAHHLRHVSSDYYDWELFALDGYTAGLNLYQQPGCHSNLWLPLWQNSMPYWFVADGRRCIVVAKVQAQYESAYLGFYDSYFTPGQVPYPMCLGGMASPATAGQPAWTNGSLRWAQIDDRHRAFTHANKGASVYDCQLHVRGFDGVYLAFVASITDNLSWVATTENIIWPYSGDLTSMDPCHDGSYALFPVMLMGAAPNPTGQLSGIYAMTGGGITPESLVRLGAVDHLVVQNVNRSDRNDFFAVRLD